MTDYYPFDGERGTIRRRAAVIALIVAFLALAVGVGLAALAPASGYEGSIYAATPIGFWVGIAVAFGVGLTVALWTTSTPLRGLSVILGGGAAIAVAGLPVLRGYHYYGELDSLTHLGWVRDLSTDALGPLDLLYPGFHTAAAAVASLTGFGLAKSVLLVVTLFLICFVVFVPLTVWVATTDRRATAIGAFAGFLLLPLNVVVTAVQAHPITQATLFLPFILAVLVRYVSGPNRIGTGVLLGLGSVALVLYHPQGAMTLLTVFIAIVIVQLVARRFTTGPIAGLRPIYAQTALLGAAFFIWTGQFDALYDQTSVALQSLFKTFAGGGEVATVVSQRSDSLSAIGSSLLEVFLKLFLVSFVFLGLSAAIAGHSFVARLDGVDDSTEGVVRLFGISIAVVGLVSILHLVGPLSKLVFRYFGIAMVFATVVGAIAIARYAPRTDDVTPGNVALGTVVSVGLAIMIALSVVSIHPSPYVHRASPQITEMQLQGYETTLNHEVEGGQILGVRWPVWRFQHAVSGVAGTDWQGDAATPELLQSRIPANAEGPSYVTVSPLDRFRELRAYEALRYSAADFDSLNSQPGLHRVQSNGGFTVYYTP